MKDASAEPSRFEPTVFGAVRRYRTMVVAIVAVAIVGAVGYTLMVGKTYRAQANVTVPQPVSAQGQDEPTQFLDSQVLLMQSQGVADQAADIANRGLGNKVLTAGSFAGSGSSLTVTPPAGAAPGVYGATIIGVSFASSSARVARVGMSAFLQAFDEARSAAISARANTAIAGIDHSISEASNQSQQATLLTQRTQQIVDEQLDLAARPTVALAATTAASSGGWKEGAAIGLVIGLVLGAALAYARASRQRGFANRQDPATIYGVPLIGEIPVFAADKTSRPDGEYADALLPVTTSPHSGVAEAFRFAAGSIEHIRAERRTPMASSGLSLIFVSPLTGGGKSTVVANLALAIAEGGTRVLAVDADAAAGGLTALLLPGNSGADGFEQVLAGQQQLGDCVRPSPFNDAVAVLGPGPASQRRLTGAARSKAASRLLAEGKARYDIVLIDSPALLEVADAIELVSVSDAAVVVLSPNELVQYHLEVVERLNLIGSDVVGYIYNRAQMRPPLGRYGRNGSSARPWDEPPASAVLNGKPLNGETLLPSQQPRG